MTAHGGLEERATGPAAGVPPFLADVVPSGLPAAVLFQSHPHPMWVMDLETYAIIAVNDAAVRHYGYSRDEFLALRATDIRPAEDVPRFLEQVGASASGGQRVGVWRHRKKDGALITVEINASDLDLGGRRARLAVIHDVTERERVEEELRLAQREFRDIFQHASIGIFRSTVEGRILLANPAFSAMLGYDRPEDVALLDLERDVYHDPDERRRIVSRYGEHPGGWSVETQWKRRDGTRIWVLLNARGVRDDAGRRYFEGFVQDVSEHRRAMRRLARSRRELRELAARLQDGAERERSMIAREIHDELGQVLTAMRMDLSWLDARLPGGAGALHAKTRSLIGLVEDTIRTVRRLSSGLRPPVLDDLGLVAAIEWLAGETTDRSGIRIALDLAEIELDEKRATAVFRIFQEALTNVVRHSGAGFVRVSLEAAHGEILLEVLDDGQGITLEQLMDSQTLGLLGMRERAIACGGSLDVCSLPERGTAVRVRMPLDARHAP